LASNAPAAIEVLQRCATTEGQGSHLILVGKDSAEYAIPSDVTLGLAGTHQRENAALAVALCTELHHRQQQNRQKKEQQDNDTPQWIDHGVNAMYKGLASVTWPARCQTGVSQKGQYTLRLDGAHTVQSVQAGLEWFHSVRDSTRPCILLFNCSHERNPVELLSLLASSGGGGVFEKVIFCPPDSSRPSAINKKTAQTYLAENHVSPIVKDWLPSSDKAPWEETLRSIWRHVNHNTAASSKDSDEEDSALCLLSMTQAVAFLETQQLPAEVFVTGSLYLVGSVLTAIGWEEPESTGRLKHMSTRKVDAPITKQPSQQLMITYKADDPSQE
jgi:folylpolyglutamate synthase